MYTRIRRMAHLFKGQRQDQDFGDWGEITKHHYENILNVTVKHFGLGYVVVVP